ncbi:hypothetical protein ACQP1O_20225 [Nocardia sp. CA-151230]|uniref:hypothetical protein n=1 Tax=Nocardia sp. CA-151230 TaxID=3239982 RepID=UPI003D8C33F5
MGFGDAFTVTVRHGPETWRMLVDCGVHSQGRARPIRDSVRAIIADLTAAAPDQRPHLDVVVATHHHADHITGFACEEWEQVLVDEVWVPFIEDPDDEDARRIRDGQTAAAHGLLALGDRRVAELDGRRVPAGVEQARMFALNAQGNAAATDRLLGRDRLGFAAPHRVRFLPSKNEVENRIEVDRVGLVAHVLGPSRDVSFLKRMDPPAPQQWPLVRAAATDSGGPITPLFPPHYSATGPLPDWLPSAKADLALRNSCTMTTGYCVPPRFWRTR